MVGTRGTWRFFSLAFKSFISTRGPTWSICRSVLYDYLVKIVVHSYKVWYSTYLSTLFHQLCTHNTLLFQPWKWSRWHWTSLEHSRPPITCCQVIVVTDSAAPAWWCAINQSSWRGDLIPTMGCTVLEWSPPDCTYPGLVATGCHLASTRGVEPIQGWGPRCSPRSEKTLMVWIHTMSQHCSPQSFSRTVSLRLGFQMSKLIWWLMFLNTISGVNGLGGMCYWWTLFLRELSLELYVKDCAGDAYDKHSSTFVHRFGKS